MQKIDRLLVVFTSCLQTVNVCSRSRIYTVGWGRLSLKSDVKSPSIRMSMAQISDKSELNTKER